MSERTVLENKAVEEEDRVDAERGQDRPDGLKSTPDGPDGTPAEPGRRPRWPRLLGAVLALALLATGGYLFAAGQQLRDTPATANLALTDTEATTRVTGDVSNALGRIFSYGPDATGLAKEAAQQVLAGKALQQYAALFGQVEKQAADQKLTLTTHVVRAGVTRLSGTGAHLLVFLDQVYERRGRPATTAAAQLSVTAELRDGHWRIVEISSI
ncbi:hypothetical protein ABT389_11790 [Streptomyces bacillaris]|uniref:Mce-associated membrane protein n=2 Tax=Streptomyces TaxID=1883 RepID=A0A1E7LT53_9ACTN|nr:hypothetical protein [Streptomyces nanshensis]OEV19387.1 hypothetical protein AN221_17395 [Streptomyces nanshensis]